MSFRSQVNNFVKLLRRSPFHYYRMAMLHPPFWLSANGQTCRVFAGNESGAGSCYAEIVVEDCCGLFTYHKRAKSQVIADIGANVGIFSKLCSLLFPQADIYAYEPNPVTLKWLEQNAEGTRIRVVPYAVSEHADVASFDGSYDSTLGRVTKEGSLTVNCVAATEVAEETK